RAPDHRRPRRTGPRREPHRRKRRRGRGPLRSAAARDRKTRVTPPRQPLHATVAAVRIDDAWRGVLIQGPSGAGKSDLALRLMQVGWRLVGDDWVDVFACEGALYAAAPATIAGRMEVRGL